jgi:hypothetical protein
MKIFLSVRRAICDVPKCKREKGWKTGQILFSPKKKLERGFLRKKLGGFKKIHPKTQKTDETAP